MRASPPAWAGLALLVIRRPSDRLLDGLLGFTAGVMPAATAFSLLAPALDRGEVWEVLAGFALGCAVLYGADRAVPHVHARLPSRVARSTRGAGRRCCLSALTIHNVPEGMAVRVAFAAGGSDLGVPIALAIGVQNIPEGFAAAAPLAPDNRALAMLVAAATGIVEPPAAILAFGAFEYAEALLPLGLAFAAGAMLHVVVDELIPESHLRGHEQIASMSVLGGIGLMMFLDNVFG